MTIQNAYELWLTTPLSKQMVTHFKRCGVYDAIVAQTSFLDSTKKNYPFGQRVYLAVNGYTDFPKCIECDKPNTKTVSIDGYQGEKRYCNKCSNLRKAVTTREHLIATLGVTNVSQLASVKQKKIDRCLLNSDGKYTNPSQDPNVQTTKRNNCLAETGGKYTSKTQTPEARAKFLNTMRTEHHVDNPSQLKWVQDKKDATSIKNRGVAHWSSLDEGKQFLSEVNRANAQQRTESLRQFYRETLGVDSFMQLPEYKELFRRKSRTKIYEKLLTSEHVEVLITLDQWLSDPDAEYTWKCKHCGNEFVAKRCHNASWSHPFYIRCPFCYPKTSSNKSKEEVELCEYVKSLGVDATFNEHSIIHPYELDCYVKSCSCAFEFNGSYWHSSAFKDEDYHKKKSDLCVSKGIDLYHVSEGDWCYYNSYVKESIERVVHRDSQIHRDYQFKHSACGNRFYSVAMYDSDQILAEFLYLRPDSISFYFIESIEHHPLYDCDRDALFRNLESEFGIINKCSWYCENSWPVMLSYLRSRGFTKTYELLPKLRSISDNRLIFEFNSKSDVQYYDAGITVMTKTL